MLDDTWFSGACCAAGCACACFERFAHDDGACVCGHARSLHAPAPRSPRPRTPAYVYLRPTLGLYWSSFSRVAALWRDRPLTVVFRPYADVDAAAREAGAVAFGLLERGPHEAPDLDMNRAMLKITSKMLDDAARATDVDDDPAVIRELLRALRKTAEGGGKLTAA